MRAGYMELLFLLLWGMLSYREAATGHGNGKCRAPDYIKFAEITIDKVMVRSKARYVCKPGYQRIVGESDLIVCKNDSGLIHWTTKTSVCKRDTSAISQQSERKPQNSAPENPVTIVPSDTAGYCGMPMPMEYATAKVTEYAVGQELHYKCLSGYDARPPTSGIRTCKEESGKIFWTSLRLQCTNDSKSVEETTQSVPIIGKCRAPDYIEFAEITIDKVMVGSKAQYECKPGYQRIVGESDFIVCKNDSEFIHWTMRTTICKRDAGAISQQSERKPQNSTPENPVTIVPSDTAGYCGMPMPVEYATAKVTEYAVGQELHYKCLSGYDIRPPTSGIRTCKEENGKIFWTSLHLQCTNDSRDLILDVFSKVAVTVLLIVFIILGWIVVQKLWKERCFAEDVKIEKTKNIATAAARAEMGSKEEAQRLESNM
ncbi:interleukin-2 receptor subunit alpha isoform X1 [Pelodiscus sinensis]|uniref:interleukin-2 receptor subunit alpha isoform X1 n=1 Tax=Pelodiscus sinensis TaxID=13735 RepID=UPI003F6BD319